MVQVTTKHIFSIPTIIEIIIIIFLFLISKIFTIILLIILIAAKFLLKGEPPTKTLTKSMKSIIYYPNSKSSMCQHTQPLPNISKHQVLVLIKAASINPVDYKVNPCLFPFIRWFISFTVARDFAGVVIETGSSITHFKEGDKVYGCAESGALAKYAVCNENKIAKIPDNISFTDIVGVALAGSTALQSLLWFYCKEELPTKKVLVIGGSGGVGSQALQILKYYNTQLVYGVCSGRNEEYVSSMCDKVINYNKNILTQISEERFDLIFDTVTSKDDVNQREIFQSYLNNNGKYVQINGEVFPFARGIFATYISRSCNIEEKDFHLHLLKWNRKDLEELAKMVEEGKLTIRNEIVKFSEDEVIRGFDRLKSRRTVGKIVFDMESDMIQY